MIGPTMHLVFLLASGCPAPLPSPEAPSVMLPHAQNRGTRDAPAKRDAPTKGDAHARSAAAAAGPALAKFLGTIDEADYEAMGFHSLAEVKDAVLGLSLRKHAVPSAALKAYDPDDDPCAIVQDTDVVDYLVMVKEDVRSLMSLARRGEQWRGVSFGSPISAKAVWTALDAVVHPKVRSEGATPAPPTDPAQYFHLTIWGVNRTFLGYVDKGVFMLIPIQGGDGLDAGTPVAASRAFAVLGHVSSGKPVHPP